jgi:hypothetical protein
MTAGDRIFLCHASEDKAQVQKLHHDLKALGFNPWLDKIDLIPGQLWKTEIPKAIREAAAVLACLSARSVAKKGYYQNEFRLALAEFAKRPPGSIYLVPVRLDVCDVPGHEIPDLGISLGDIHRVDLFEEGGFDQLVRAIQSALSASEPGIQASPPPLPAEPVNLFGRPEIFSPPVLRSPLLDEDPPLSWAINERTLEKYTKWKYPDLPIDKKVQGLLLRDLNKEHYKLIGDLDHAVNAASEAVQRYKNEQPGLFKSGTDHLTKSLGFADHDFLGRHPFGRETREAYKRYHHLVRLPPRGG